MSDMPYPCVRLSAAAVPAPCPMAMHVAMTRAEPKPDPSASRHRPAVTRLTLPAGTRHRNGMLYSCRGTTSPFCSLLSVECTSMTCAPLATVSGNAFGTRMSSLWSR